MSHHIEKPGMRTLAVHAGEQPDPTTGASAPNLVMSTTFIADPEMCFSAEGFEEDAPFFYTRFSNPTVQQLEQKLAHLEDAEACVALGSGMAVVSALLLHSLRPGDRLVMSDVAYAGASELANGFVRSLGIQVEKVNLSDLSAARSAVTRGVKLVYAETPCNPILRLTDISALAEIAHRAGAKLAVDSTFATPIATRPISLGADYVVHSLTKYLGGHGDALGGALLGPQEELSQLRQQLAIRLGGVLSPFNAWLIIRGLATLPLRMQAHQEAALATAAFLEGHPKVTRVICPGLPSHPQHELAKRQMRNFSGMLTFQVRDGAVAARVLAQRLRVIHYAVSLGHHRSLVIYLPTDEMIESSFKLSGAALQSYRELAGDGVFRFSAGIEDPQDLCDDLAMALDAVP